MMMNKRSSTVRPSAGICHRNDAAAAARAAIVPHTNQTSANRTVGANPIRSLALNRVARAVIPSSDLHPSALRLLMLGAFARTWNRSGRAGRPHRRSRLVWTSIKISEGPGIDLAIYPGPPALRLPVGEPLGIAFMPARCGAVQRPSGGRVGGGRWGSRVRLPALQSAGARLSCV
jgi:hypothetical protein